MEGLVKFTVKEVDLMEIEKGKSPGAMRGEWWGDELGTVTQKKQETEKKSQNRLPDGWDTASAIAALIRHMMIADKQVNDGKSCTCIRP